MATWEEARQMLYPLNRVFPDGFTTEPVPLDYLTRDAPCVACGYSTVLHYQGRPLHAICATEIAMYALLVRQGRAVPFVFPDGSATGGPALPLPPDA